MDLINLRFKTSTAWLKLQLVYEDAQKKAFPIANTETNADTIRKELLKLQKRMERKQLYKW